jgi:uncharacterized protein
MLTNVELHQESLVEFCRRNRIVKLAVFGSVLRDDFRPDSDIDVLVEFEPGTHVGLIRLGTIEGELSDLLKHPVDLNTPAALSPYFRDEVLREAETIYDAA